MGVYIKGMTLPPTDNGRLIIFDDGAAIWYDLDTKERKEYEVVQLPPHGRLIDVDAFVKNLDDTVLFSGRPNYNGEIVGARKVVNRLFFAPTIIPAEEGE